MKQITCCLAVLAALAPTLSAAQERDAGGVSFTLGLSQTLEASSDRDLATDAAERGLEARTRLSFGALSETRTERLSLDLSGGLRLGDDTTTRDSSRARLAYARQGADARLELSATWDWADVAFLRDVEEFRGPDGLIVLPDDLDELTATGTRETTTLDARLIWGETAPVGYDLSASHRVLRYDTDTASLTDAVTNRVGAGLRLRLDPVTQARLDLSYSETDEVGSAPEDRLTLSGALTLERPLGDITARLGASRDDAGDVYWQASLGRALDLPGARLSGQLGLVEDSSDQIRLTGTLRYSQETPTGQISLSAAQSVAPGGDRRSTSLSAGYSHAVTPLSTLGLGLDVARATDLDGDADLTTGSLSASYGWEVTRGWDLRLGARAELRDDAGDRNRSSTAFVQLSRSLSWRP